MRYGLLFYSQWFLISCLIVICYGSPEVVTIPVIYDLGPLAPQILSVYQLAEQDINNSSDILPNIKLELDIRNTFGPAACVAAVIDMDSNNLTYSTGGLFETNVDQIGITGATLGIGFHSPVVTTEILSDKKKFPFFSRTCAAGSLHVKALFDALAHFSEVSGPGWTDIAIMSVASLYGINFSELFVEYTSGSEQFTIIAYQQFLNDYISTPDFDIELQEIARSGARIISFFGFYDTFRPFIVAANDVGLVGDNYVYVSTDGLACAELSFIGEEIQMLARGMLGTCQDLQPFGIQSLNEFTERWHQLDPEVYRGTGPGTYPGGFGYLTYDSIWVIAHAIETLDEKGLLDLERIPAEEWQQAVIDVTISDGLSGDIRFDENGDRTSGFSVRYYDPTFGTFVKFANWSTEEGLEVVSDVIWITNTTQIPDLDIREPFDYWSCHKKELLQDKTGKTVQLHTPDRSDVDDIDADYYCDNFIDCKNLSDESVDCSHNYTILFIVFGIITGFCLLFTVFLLIFVIVFGIIFRYQTLRVSSPLFLVILLISTIIGYSSIYLWFGKPHPVACAFQPWLLGLPTLSTIAVLCAKSFRVWRIFKSEFRKQTISDMELMGLWLLAVLPAVFIVTLWTIISTPTAAMEDIRGEEHYICTTGGFTGSPGGYIFFAIFVAYSSIILVFGVAMSIATRNVPSVFNESKLLAISIYNLGLLAVVIIPVFLVVNPFNPFVAWILRTLAILYAYTSILVMQFATPVLKIIIWDKCKNVPVKFTSVANSSSAKSSGESLVTSPR